jgi:protein tyrosine phosphatase
MFFRFDFTPKLICLFIYSNGVSRTGPFLSLFTSIQDIDEGRSFPDLNKIIRLLRSKRRHMIQDMNQLKFIYETFLYYNQDFLVKRKN